MQPLLQNDSTERQLQHTVQTMTKVHHNAKMQLHSRHQRSKTTVTDAETKTDDKSTTLNKLVS